MYLSRFLLSFLFLRFIPILCSNPPSFLDIASRPANFDPVTQPRHSTTNMTMTRNEGPCVLIAGAGFGGLLLGAILEKAGIEYHIFERAKDVKPLGTYSQLVTGLLFLKS